MPAIIIMFALQVLVAFHALKTGRPVFWVWLIIAVPVLGTVLYLAVEILPEMSKSRGAGRAVRKVHDAIDPDGELRAAMQELDGADTVANRQRVADAHMALAHYEEARDGYRTCLVPPHEHDADILLKIARAAFEADDPTLTRTTLESLIAHNPEYQSTDGHLLYARALEQLGELDKACSEYAVLVASFPGEEATIRYARLLHDQGQSSDARDLLTETVARARRAPEFYQQREREWLEEARQILDQIAASDDI